MEALATASFSLGVIAYSAACTLLFLGLDGRRAPRLSEFGAGLLAVAAALHLAHVVLASLLTRICPVESIHFALSLSALVAVVAFLVVRRGRRLDPLGVFVGPLALTLLVAAQFISPSAANPALSRGLLALHVTANLIGFALVLLAGGAALFYVLAERRLKAKRAGALGRMPSLEALDLVAHRLLLLGFPLLTFGLVTGGVFVSQLDGASGASHVRAVLGALTWLQVAFVLLSRALLGWRGRRAAYGTLVGVAAVGLVVAFYVLRSGLGTGA
jgi:ABC-type uncharacterized transport system permease subunit